MKLPIVVVGGAGGIGSAIVRRFCKSGFDVIVADIDIETGECLANCLESATFMQTDVLNLVSVNQLRDRIEERWGGVYSLVSLAGRAKLEEFNGLKSLNSEIIKSSIELNLTSHLVITNQFLNLLEQGSSVTLVSSINALRGFGLPAYSAAKAGLIGFVKAAACELGERGVRINAVLPGTVKTPATEAEPKDFTALLGSSTLNRLTTTEEIAELVFQISVNLTCITGQEVVGDCGQLVKVQL